MKCLKEFCGAEIPIGARVCTECKTEVHTTVPDKTSLCPSCNKIVLETCTFCYYCGGKIDPALFIDRVCSGTKADGQKCKTVLTSGTKFCPFCGTPQGTPYTLTGPVDKAGPNLANQKTGEPQDNEQAGLVDKKSPDLTDQQRVTPQGSGLSVPIAKEDPDLIDKQSLEPKGGRSSCKIECLKEFCTAEIPVGARVCTECKTEVQTVPVRTTLCPSCNNIVLETYTFCYCCGGKIDPALFIDRVCSGTKADGQKCNTVLTSGTRFCPSCGTPQGTPYTLNQVNLPGDEPLKLSLQITHQEEDCIDITTPIKEEHHSPGYTIFYLRKDPNITQASNDKKTELGKEFTQIETTEPGGVPKSNSHRFGIKRISETDIALVESKKNKTEDPSNEDVQKCENKEDLTGSELEVILISDSESDEDGQARKEEPVDTTVKAPKRKNEVDVEEEIKKFKGGAENKNPDANKEVQHVKTPADEKYGTQETEEQERGDENIGQSDENNEEQRKPAKHKNRQDCSNGTDQTKDKPENSQLVEQRENPEEEKPLREKSKPEENPASIMTTRSKKGNQSDQAKDPEKENRTIYSRTDPKLPERTETFFFNLSHFNIHFHAIMHASIFDERCRVFVRFAIDNLGGWKSNKNELYPIKKFQNGNCEVEGQVALPRGFIEKKISYKYFIVCENDEQQEFVYNQKDKLRCLYVTSKQLKSLNDVFHQYDGVIRGNKCKKGITNYLRYLTGYEASQYKKMLTEDAKQSAISFLPPWLTDSGSTCGLTGDDMIMRINILYRGLCYCYCKNTNAIAEKDLKNLFTEAIQSGLDTLWKEFISLRDFSFEARMKIFKNAVTVAYLFHDYAFQLSSDELSTLSVALLPEIEMSGQSTCIDNMKAVFSQTFQKIPDVLMYVVNRNLELFNASWLCSMPLIHFLYKQCYPGEKPSEDTKHDYHRPYWWGIADKEHYWICLKVFKGKIVDSEVLKDMLGRLAPYFEMDYLLQRALMASLNLEQLPDVAKTRYISTDIILASLCYYVREERNISKDDSKETAIIECLTVVKNKFSEENYEKSMEYLKCAWRSFMIAADVLKSMKDRRNKLTDNVMALALDAFLISLHVYFTLYNSNKESIDKTVGMGSYETTLNAVQNGMSSVLKEKMQWSKKNELLACLKSWDRMLNVPVPPGLIRDQFTTFIAKSLRDSLKHKNLDEKLVEVYFQNQNIFCEAMMEVLTNYVVDIQRGWIHNISLNIG